MYVFIRSESVNRMLMSYYFPKEYGQTKITKGEVCVSNILNIIQKQEYTLLF